MGGLTRLINKLTVWIFILTVMAFMLIAEVGRIRKNYTKLHHRVNQLEMIHKRYKPQKKEEQMLPMGKAIVFGLFSLICFFYWKNEK